MKNRFKYKKRFFTLMVLFAGLFGPLMAMKRKRRRSIRDRQLKKKRRPSQKSLTHLSPDSLRCILSFLTMKEIASTSIVCKKLLQAAYKSDSIHLPGLNGVRAARHGNLHLIRMWVSSLDPKSDEYREIKWALYWAFVKGHKALYNFLDAVMKSAD